MTDIKLDTTLFSGNFRLEFLENGGMFKLDYRNRHGYYNTIEDDSFIRDYDQYEFCKEIDKFYRTDFAENLVKCKKNLEIVREVYIKVKNYKEVSNDK